MKRDTVSMAHSIYNMREHHKASFREIAEAVGVSIHGARELHAKHARIERRLHPQPLIPTKALDREITNSPLPDALKPYTGAKRK